MLKNAVYMDLIWIFELNANISMLPMTMLTLMIMCFMSMTISVLCVSMLILAI